MSAQQMWEARTSGPKRAEAPSSGQAVGASENAQSETVHIPKNTLVLTPLRIELWDRDRHGHPVQPGELIAHSDAGSQYTSLRFAEHLAAEGIAASIGTVADAYDNALMECVIGLYKTECITTTIFHNGPYKTIADVEYATAGWVEWYNNRRLHSSLAMTTPAEYETAYYAALNRELAPT